MHILQIEFNISTPLFTKCYIFQLSQPFCYHEFLAIIDIVDTVFIVYLGPIHVKY